VIRSLLRLFVVVCAIALVVPAALAVDGVVLINQNTSINGLPGCLHAGFPIQICQPGSYRLSGNLTVPEFQTAIEINADQVTLDLNGFSITGPVTCQVFSSTTTSCTGSAGWGVTASYRDHITIRNGSIKGMYTGISVSGKGVLIEEIHAARNRYSGIYAYTISNDSSTILRRNTVIQNGDLGMVAYNASISENVAQGNKSHGMSANSSQVSRNVSTHNGGVGIRGVVSTLSDNTLNSNGTAGLFVDRCLYGGNMMWGNDGGAIIAESSISQNNNYCSGSAC
jgi:hypothetical protein